MTFEEVRTILESEKREEFGFGAEGERRIVSIVCDEEGKYYVRVYEERCATENNGRPVTTIKDMCYPIESPESVTEENWQEFCMFRMPHIELCRKSYVGVPEFLQ